MKKISVTFTFTSVSEIYFYNCTFTNGNGNNPLFDFIGSTGSQIIFSGCNFSNCELGAIEFNSQSASSITTDISILNCIFDNNGQNEASSDIALYYCQGVTIKGCIFKNNSNASTSLTNGQSIASVYIDATCNDILVTDCMFSNIGQLNISGGSGYGIQANNVENLMVIKNTFRNAKAVMIAPCTGALTQSGYVEGNIWNPQQFFNTTNVTNNPQSNLGFTFNTVVNGFPTIINTDVIRKEFNMDKLGTQWWPDYSVPTETIITSPNRPCSIIARKTSLGWVARQTVASSMLWGEYDSESNTYTNAYKLYFLVPFIKVWVDTLQFTLIGGNIGGYAHILPAVSTTITNEYMMYAWMATSSTQWSAVTAEVCSPLSSVEGLVDIEKVINLTSINQYLPS